VSEPQASPAGRLDGASAAWRRPDRRLLQLRRVVVLLCVTAPGLVASAAAGFLLGPPEGLAGLALTAALTGLLLQAVRRRYEAWGYLERADDLLVRRGVLVRRTSVVPYGRMQYVDVTAGPLDRRMGLATVTLHTAAAATDASVPGLLLPEATRLRDRLAALGEARQAGV
jgi:membrane protein YdbS with pleckstrin-like domain